jgi:hypothetical protein
MELIRMPKDMDELYDMIVDMRGSQADLARVAIMARQLGFAEGEKAAASCYGETS